MKTFKRLLCALPFLGIAATAHAFTPDISLVSSSATVNEDAGTITLDVVLTNVAGGGVFSASVDYITSPGTATASLDYTPTVGVLNFSESSLTQSIVVPIINDNLVEDAETFSIQLLNPQVDSSTSTPTMTVDTSTVTIVDDDENATLSFAESSVFVTEDEGTVLLAVNRSGNAGGPVSLTLTALGGTATLGDDYVPSPAPLEWADQELGVKFFPVTIVDDTEVEPDENFNVTLGSITGAAEVGGITTVIITITDNDEPGVPVIQNLPQTVGEDAGTVTIRVSRVGGSSGQLEVTYQTSDVTANAPEDYVTTTGVLTWADGDTSDRTIPITIIDDGLVEDEESLRLSLTDPNDPNQPIIGDLSITDNDANAIVEFSDAALSVNETDGTVTLSVTRTGNSAGPVSVDFSTLDGSAEAGSDYVTSTGVLEWGDGETDARTMVINILDDSFVEEEESFTVVLSNPQGQADLGQNNPATITIVSDDTPNPGEFIFADTPLSVDEAAGTATITLSRVNGTDGELTVLFTVADGTATAPDDYVPTEVEVTWPDGDDTDRTVELSVIDDDIIEGDETLTLSLADINDPSAAIVTEELTIVDNDVNAELAFFELSVNASEEDGVATVTVTRTGSSAGEVSVDVIAQDGTAVSPEDYSLPSANTLTWLSGETGPRTVDITIIDDAIHEEEETFYVSLVNVTGPASLGTETTATVVIADNDPPTLGGPQFVTTSVETTEEVGILSIVVLREGDPSGPLDVAYSTENNTAIAPDDFTAVSGTLTWVDGDTTSRTIDIQILDDGLVESDEVFIVNLDNLTDPAAPRVFTRVTIADNDVNAALEFVDLTVSTNEQDEAVTVTVTRSGNATGPVTVDFATEDGSATAPDDYAAAAGTLAWADGELGERSITVSIVDDNIVEDEEDFTIMLSNITGQASLGANSAITVLISASDGQRNISELPQLNPNQQQVANWFDRTCPRLTAMTDLTEEQQDLAAICQSIRNIETSDEEVGNAIDEIMPNELFVSSFNALRLTSIQHGNLSQRINALRNGATGIDLAGLDIEINGEVIAGKQVEEFVSDLVGGAAGADGLNWGKWGAFIDGRIVTGKKDKGDLEEAFDFDIYGFTAGIDYRIKQNFIVGGAVGYGVVDSDFRGSGGGMDIESVTASAFLTYFNDSTYYFDAMATWGRNDYESKRNINFSAAGIDIQRQAVGKTDGDQYSFGFGSGFDFSSGPLTYGPHVGAYYFNVASDSFTERGASGLELVVGDQRSESLTANLGGHISYVVNTDWGVFVPNARVDWVNEFKDNRETLSFNFLHDPFANDPSNPSPGIKILTDRPDPSYFIWSVGVHTQLIYGISGFIDYKSFSGYDNVTLQEVSWGMRWEKTW